MLKQKKFEDYRTICSQAGAIVRCCCFRCRGRCLGGSAPTWGCCTGWGGIWGWGGRDNGVPPTVALTGWDAGVSAVGPSSMTSGRSSGRGSWSSPLPLLLSIVLTSTISSPSLLSTTKLESMEGLLNFIFNLTWTGVGRASPPSSMDDGSMFIRFSEKRL